MNQSFSHKKYSIYNKNNLIERRIRAACIDTMIISILKFIAIGMILDNIEKCSNLKFAVISLSVYFVMILLEIILFKGSSFGKKRQGLKIVFKNGKYNIILLYFRRLITFALIDLNILMIIIYKKTICDIIFNTRVVNVDD